MSRLTAEQCRRFAEQGYLQVPGVLDEEDLTPLRSVIDAAVDRLATRLYDQGKIPDVYEAVPARQRLFKLLGPDAEWTWNKEIFSAEVHELLTQPKLLDIIESLIGPEITVHGDYWLRFKMPAGEPSAFPWHQDSVYYNANMAPGQQETPTEESQILTVWIPLVDVDEQNGPLQMVSGSHKHGLQPARRNAKGRRVPLIDVGTLGAVETQTMRVGDVLIFGNLTFHRSLANDSDAIRWSIDLRYSPTDAPLDWFREMWPGFIAHSRSNPGSVEAWEIWQARRGSMADG